MSFLQITDLIIIGLAALLGLIGLFKGLTKQLFSILALGGAIACVIFLGNPIINLFASVDEMDLSTKCIYYIAIFLVVYIVVRIIGAIISKGAEKSPLGLVNRILGLAWGVAKAAIIVCVVLIAYQAITKIGFVNDLFSKWIDLENKGWGITIWLYENNFITKIIELIGKKA